MLVVFTWCTQSHYWSEYQPITVVNNFFGASDSVD